MNMNLEGFFRFIALLSYLLLALPFMWLCVPFRLIHGLLRLLGVPNAWLPLDLVTWAFCRGLLFFAGAKVQVIGAERVKGTHSIIMGNHSSGLDPFLLSATCPLMPLYIFKRELIFLFPPLFMLGYVYGHVPIVRSSREKAIIALAKAAKKAQKFHRSLCIFPEGTRTNNGDLLPFKSGPFYLAHDVGSTIQPVYIFGAYSLMPPSQLAPNRRGTVIVEYQPQIDAKGKTHEELKAEVLKCLTAAQERWRGKKIPSDGWSALWCVIPLVAMPVAYNAVKNILFY